MLIQEAFIKGVKFSKDILVFIINFRLEAVCLKKQQKKVPDQLLVCGIGDL